MTDTTITIDLDVPIPFALTDLARLHLFRRRVQIVPIRLTKDDRAELAANALDDLRVEVATDAWEREHPDEAAFRDALEHDRWVECATAMDADGGLA